MKRFITTCIIAVGLLIPVAATVQAEPRGGHERHPEIHGALHALEVARTRLEKANHDFGGHREAALRACNTAIEQLRLALEFDR